MNNSDHDRVVRIFSYELYGVKESADKALVSPPPSFAFRSLYDSDHDGVVRISAGHYTPGRGKIVPRK